MSESGQLTKRGSWVLGAFYQQVPQDAVSHRVGWMDGWRPQHTGYRGVCLLMCEWWWQGGTHSHVQIFQGLLSKEHFAFDKVNVYTIFHIE